VKLVITFPVTSELKSSECN